MKRSFVRLCSVGFLLASICGICARVDASEFGLKPNAGTQAKALFTQYGMLALHEGYDAIVEDPTIAKTLVLDYGVNIDSHDAKYGQTVLFRAASSGKLALMRTLLSLGANPNHRAKYLQESVEWPDHALPGQTPLIHAVKSFQTEASALLLEHGALVDLRSCQ